METEKEQVREAVFRSAWLYSHSLFLHRDYLQIFYLDVLIFVLPHVGNKSSDHRYTA
jgi:hypothetical protein